MAGGGCRFESCQALYDSRAIAKIHLRINRRRPKTPAEAWKFIRAHEDFEAVASMTLVEAFMKLQIGDLIDISEAIE